MSLHTTIRQISRHYNTVDIPTHRLIFPIDQLDFNEIV